MESSVSSRVTAKLKHLIVMLPALDEEISVGDVVRGIPRSITGIDWIKIVVIDDGSRDATALRAREAGAHVIVHGHTRGVGAAFQTGLAYGLEQGADIILNIDADGQFDPSDIPKIVAPVVAGEADFVSASRFADPNLEPEMPALKRWGNRMMSRLVSRLSGQKFYDVSCGMRCYNREAALKLHLLGRFTYTQEVFLNLSFKQLRITEVPIRVRGEREFGESRVANSLWRYGFRTARIIFRCYRDYHPLRFFGGLALLLVIPAFLLGGFLGVHYLSTGGFAPHKWAGFISATLFVTAILVLQVGVIGDMLNRHREYLEELLYHQRSRARLPLEKP
ncbi:MAG: glycosyltransferase family 2 protein [Acidobacteria bacterium]|nr:MAG: glycosyltransferase family 2 protein [Acidobacteriota bacterium]